MSNSSDPARPSPVPPAPRARWVRGLQNLALMSGSFLLCLLVAELLLRFAGYGRVEIYLPDPVLYWKLKPNQDCYTKIDRRPVHINSHGTRGPEFAVPKPPRTFRILSLGDSKTFGWGLAEAQTYSKLLEQELQQLAGSNARVEVINAGVNGWSYPQLHFHFRDYGIRWQPDVVLVGDANLFTQFSDRNSPEFIRSFLRRVRLKNFLRRFALYHYVVEYKLQKVYERQRVRFLPVDPKHDPLFREQQQKDPAAFFREQVDAICRLALTNGIKPVLLYIPTLNSELAADTSDVRRAKVEVSRELAVPLVDSTDALRPGGKLFYLEADPVHLNPAGNQLIARLLATNLARVLVP